MVFSVELGALAAGLEAVWAQTTIVELASVSVVNRYFRFMNGVRWFLEERLREKGERIFRWFRRGSKRAHYSGCSKTFPNGRQR